MEGNWNGAQGNNKYQYNAKEWNDDFGLGWNHHDWRFFDVAINRFVTIDPEGETGEQRSWNPYHFSFDNPIRYSDPDGRFPIETIWDVVNIVYDGGRVIYHYATGNTPAATSAAVDVGADLVAVATPYLPAGWNKVGKAVAKTVTAAETATTVVDFSKTRKDRPLTDVPKDKKEIEAERKRINRESNGKPNKEQRKELQKLKKQEKFDKQRHSSHSGNQKKPKKK